MGTMGCCADAPPPFPSQVVVQCTGLTSLHCAAHPLPSTPSHHGHATPRLVLPCTGDRERRPGKGACQPRCCRSPCALFQIVYREMDRTRRIRTTYDKPPVTSITRRPTSETVKSAQRRLQQPLREAFPEPRLSMCFHHHSYSLRLRLHTTITAVSHPLGDLASSTVVSS